MDFDSQDILDAVTFLASASLLIPVGLGLVSWSRISPSFRALVIGLGCYLVILRVSLFYSEELHKWGEHITTYIFSLLYGVTFTMVYALALPRGSLRRTLVFIGAGSIFYLLVDIFLLSGPNSLAGYSVLTMTVALVVSTLIFIYHLVRHPTENSLLIVPLFWVAGAKLLSGLGSGSLDVFGPQLREYSDRLLTYMYIFALVVIIICNILYAVGIWKERQYLSHPSDLPA